MVEDEYLETGTSSYAGSRMIGGSFSGSSISRFQDPFGQAVRDDGTPLPSRGEQVSELAEKLSKQFRVKRD